MGFDGISWGVTGSVSQKVGPPILTCKNGGYLFHGIRPTLAKNENMTFGCLKMGTSSNLWPWKIISTQDLNGWHIHGGWIIVTRPNGYSNGRLSFWRWMLLHLHQKCWTSNTAGRGDTCLLSRFSTPVGYLLLNMIRVCPRMRWFTIDGDLAGDTMGLFHRDISPTTVIWAQ